MDATLVNVEKRAQDFVDRERALEVSYRDIAEKMGGAVSFTTIVNIHNRNFYMSTRTKRNLAAWAALQEEDATT